jgi:hypothetical protein
MALFSQQEQQFKRQVSYLNRDFGEFRRSLINYAQQYFPDTINDFSEASPFSLGLEMAAYVGDVLSFYTDTQLRESLLSSVEEKINLYNLAQAYGYKVQTRTPSAVMLDVYQLVPSLGDGALASPDMRYAQVVDRNMIVSSDTNVFFRTLDEVDFRASSSLSPLDVSVYSVTPEGNVEYYLLKKQVPATSGEIISREFQFTDPKPYDKIVLPDSNVLDIVDVTDDDSNVWYEVPYLAQDLIPKEIKNTSFNSPRLSKYASSVPYLLCYKQTERRFVTRMRKDDLMELQFGSGMSEEADEEIVPNPFNIGIGLEYFKRTVDLSVDPKNFLYTKTYGTAPQNTTLTVRYTIGGGVSDNVAANTIRTINTVSFKTPINSLDADLLATVQDSLVVNNPDPAYGGGSQKEIDRVRLEAMAHFASQNRAVTREDYILRCYTMPVRFGTVAKAFVIQDDQISTDDISQRIPNPFALNLYILAYNDSGQFVAANPAIKENLRTYLKQHRMMTDAINIKDANIINIGVEADIIVRPQYNSNEVIFRCIERLKDILHNRKLEINQPLFIGNLVAELDKVEGVQSVPEFKIVNKYDIDQGYSGNVYDIDAATRGNVLYPSLDPSIFEVRSPNTDIKIRVVDF